MKKTIQRRSHVTDIANGVRSGNIPMLARAITLCESSKTSDRKSAYALLSKLLAHTGRSLRIGITGSPGVGKSTFIEAFGKHLTSRGKKVAVLAVDPSSEKTKGSILGDKTRMEELAKDPKAFIRPTASSHALGGVANATRESILLCEAAGFDIVLVETVGVGQSETAVRNMVDFFLLLQLAGAGDELQGIKKGIMEMADGIVITKADGDNAKRAKQAQAEFQHALHLFQASESGWQPKVLISSAIEEKGVEETWKMIDGYQHFTNKNSFLSKNRARQNLQWFHESLDSAMKIKLFQTKKMTVSIKAYEKKVMEGKTIPSKAAEEVCRILIT